MNSKSEQIISFEIPNQTNSINFNFDLTDDDDDDNDEGDDDSPDSIEDVQQILQTFGATNRSTLSIDYFDSCRYEIMFEIMNIEKQFEELKNVLYKENVLLIDRKLISVQNEEAPEYQDELKKLYDEMQLRLETAKQRRHIELQALENSIESEFLSLEQTLENDKHLLYDQLHEELEQKIHELETLKVKTKLCANILQEMLSSEQQSRKISTSKKRLNTSESSKQNPTKRRLNGSMKNVEKINLAIIYQIPDVNVIEDWAHIQTSLQQSNESGISNDSDKSNDNDDNDSNRLVVNVNY